jgi:hypothetical protein
MTERFSREVDVSLTVTVLLYQLPDELRLVDNLPFLLFGDESIATRMK